MALAAEIFMTGKYTPIVSEVAALSEWQGRQLTGQRGTEETAFSLSDDSKGDDPAVIARNLIDLCAHLRTSPSQHQKVSVS